ncbi:hypothetical protein [Intrasporangium sp. YIM S08009]|uniref:hypothetical protein n=1 Tax=Intrasporangium zincisolvens TaxID=3080018 RepID=UPI002B05879D|nr:hypothetical protein [Intrasporangium sp. YIM S08009]
MSPSPVPDRPRLPAWLRPYVRRPGEVQFGLRPGAPVVEGVTPQEAALLAGLDGSLTREQTYAVAADAGVARRRWRDVLLLATSLGVLVDAARVVGTGPRGPHGVEAPGPVPSASPSSTAERRRVLVDGDASLAADVAAALCDAGSALVVSERSDVDVAVADPGRDAPALVVLVGAPLVDPRRGDVWLRHGVPHLPVSGAGPAATVGPLVTADGSGPCLWCLERHRTDRDDAWPTVLTQAMRHDDPAPAGVRVTGTSPWREPLAPGLSQLVAGAVTLLAGRVLRGDVLPGGVSVEVGLPWPRMDHRRWSPHPLCTAHPDRADAAALRPA